MKSSKLFYLMIGWVIFAASIISCAPPLSSEKNITAFSFEKAKNSFLADDVKGVIKDNSITLAIPANITVTNLVATFTITGVKVEVNSVEQESGVTENNFTNDAEYVVTAQDGSTKKYTVAILSTIIQHGKIFNSSKQQIQETQITYKSRKYLLSDDNPLFNPAVMDQSALLMQNCILSSGTGPDNIWLTSDDTPIMNLMMISDTRSVQYNDFDRIKIGGYTDYTLSNGLVTKAVAYVNNKNGIWFDSDDIIGVCRKYEYDVNGRPLRLRYYMDNEVSLLYLYKYTYNSDNTIDTITQYNDNEVTIACILKFYYTDNKLTQVKFFTGSELKLKEYTNLSYNAQGRMNELKLYDDGGDGIISDDDHLRMSMISEFNEYGYVSNSDLYYNYNGIVQEQIQLFTYEYK